MQTSKSVGGDISMTVKTERRNCISTIRTPYRGESNKLMSMQNIEIKRQKKTPPPEGGEGEQLVAE